MAYDTATEVQPATPAPFTKRIVTLFDTTEDGHPAEAVLFGEDMRAVRYATRNGQDWITLNGPDGEIDLPVSAWREIAKMMGVGA